MKPRGSRDYYRRPATFRVLYAGALGLGTPAWL